jgi:S-DNA-T family DNA segregation ATPase FtsK/SpoIIIE
VSTTINGHHRPSPPGTATIGGPVDLAKPRQPEDAPRFVEPAETPVEPAQAPEDPIEASSEREASAFRRTARRIRTAATHERTRGTLRLTARHSAYLIGGAGVVAKRAWHGRTVAVHHQMRQSAIAAGDHAGAAEWQDRADRFRQARHQRRMDLLTKAPHMVQSTAIGIAGGPCPRRVDTCSCRYAASVRVADCCS